MTKEEIYDTQILPLLAQIFQICVVQHMAFVASCAIPTDALPTQIAHTAHLSDDTGTPDLFVAYTLAATGRDQRLVDNIVHAAQAYLDREQVGAYTPTPRHIH